MGQGKGFIDSGGFRGRKFVGEQSIAIKGKFLRFRLASTSSIDLELNGTKLANVTNRNALRLAYWILDNCK